MLKGTPPLDITKYASKKGVPIRFLNVVVETLVDAGYLARIADDESRYALLKSPSVIRVSDVIDVIMNVGIKPAGLGLSRVAPGMLKVVQEASNKFNESMNDRTIEELLNVDAKKA